MVRGVKTFVLKCHSCFKICMDATREFCPHCGNHTMMKVRCVRLRVPLCVAPVLCLLTSCVTRQLQVSMAVDEDGVVHYSRGIKRFNLVCLVLANRQHDDRYRTPAANSMDDFNSINSRKANVQDNDIWMSLGS